MWEDLLWRFKLLLGTTAPTLLKKKLSEYHAIDRRFTYRLPQ
jgi:hypothetical protein